MWRRSLATGESDTSVGALRHIFDLTTLPIRLQGWHIEQRLPTRRPRVTPPGMHPPFVLAACKRAISVLCRRRRAHENRHASGVHRSTPGALAPSRVVLSRPILTYSAPSVPLAGTSRLHRRTAYTRCLRCACPPRRPTSGSGLSS